MQLSKNKKITSINMIEIPFKKVIWNEHEAALLVDTFEKVRNGIVFRDKAIVELSKRLRNRMILDGIAINEKRNYIQS